MMSSSQQSRPSFAATLCKWVQFHVAVVLTIGIVLAIAIPLYVKVLRPEREDHASHTLEHYTCSKVESSILANLSMGQPEAQDRFLDIYEATVPQPGGYEAALNNFAWLQSVLNLTVSADQLDPDSQSLHFRVSGQAYGYITYNNNHDILMLSLPSSVIGYNVSSPVRSCKQPLSGAPGCADLVIQCGAQHLSYSTGDGLGRNSVIVEANAERGRDNYPFDVYTATGVIKASIAMQGQVSYISELRANAAQMDLQHLNKTLPGRGVELDYISRIDALKKEAEEMADRFDAYELIKPVPMRLQMQFHIPGWTVADAWLQHSVQYTRERSILVKEGSKQADRNRAAHAVLTYSITYTRSNFTKLFAFAIMLTMWGLSAYLFVIALDHVVVRPRKLEADTVGYSVGMLFALPALRLLIEAPFGSYIDFLAFAWNMVLVTFAVFIVFSGTFVNHRHHGGLFQMHDEGATATQAVP